MRAAYSLLASVKTTNVAHDTTGCRTCLGDGMVVLLRVCVFGCVLRQAVKLRNCTQSQPNTVVKFASKGASSKVGVCACFAQ
jgi:hypothetical protein